MNILVVCQHYYPESFQVTEICEYLVKKEHSVTALVGLPNYPLGYVLKEYKNGKKRNELINGVKIVRCSEIGRRNNIIFLALNYLSFWISSIFKVNSLNERFDIVFGYETSPITMVDAGRIYAKKNNVPFILWCCDIWPECLKVYIKSESNVVFKMFKKISRKIYNSADRILCSSSSFVHYLNRTHQINKEKLIYLPQFGDDNLTKIDFTPKNAEVVNFVFMGNVGREQELSNVIKAFEKIRNTNFIFHIIGDGSDFNNVRNYAKKSLISSKIKFYGKIHKNELIQFYKLANVCILPLRHSNDIGLTIPNKLQNYMAAGKPILGMISGPAKEIIEKAKCGYCVEGNDIDGFSKIIDEFIINKSKYNEYAINSKEYYIKNFSKDLIMKRIEELIEEN